VSWTAQDPESKNKALLCEPRALREAIFRMGESLSFGKSVARALKRIGFPAAEVANADALSMSANQGTRQTGERRLCQRRTHRGRRHADAAAAVNETPRL
jgi:hypothetical protein